jgi:hypothetical protein
MAHPCGKYWNKKKSLHERSILMLLSTLPDLPGRTYDVIGVVCDHIELDSSNQGELMLSSIIEQASRMGADAIVDIKMIPPSGSSLHFSMIIVIGTAVKLK